MIRPADEALRNAVRGRVRQLYAETGYRPGVDRFRERVRSVVLIGSSSRGGSSIFAEILRRTPQLLHLRAEINPFFVLHDRAWPVSGTGSDALHISHAEHLDELDADLAQDCGTAEDGLAVEDEEGFAVELTARLLLQWPTEAIGFPVVRRAMDETLRTLRADYGWRRGAFPDVQLFHALLLARLRRVYPAVNLYYYDLSRELVAKVDPTCPPPSGPPSPWLVEEPPFVTIAPWRRADAEALATRALVVKTPSNAYRLSFFKALFPNARLRILHLTRNVAASVNGLYDGWRFPGFWSHAVDRPLDIHGYSDHFPEWARSWWKFDLAPGWQRYAREPLTQVCAFQWRSAHTAILDWLEHHPEDTLRLRFEDVVGATAARQELYDRLTRWLGVELDPALAAARDGTLPTVMATETPRRRRWFDRAELLSPVLADPASHELMERLGYDPDPDHWT